MPCAGGFGRRNRRLGGLETGGVLETELFLVFAFCGGSECSCAELEVGGSVVVVAL